MKRPWLIRSLFILPILVCVGGWVSGLTCSIEFIHGGSNAEVYVWNSPGGICFFYLRGEWEDPQGWHYHILRGGSVAEGASQIFILGFRFGSEESSVFYRIPFWSLTVASSGLLWFVWRKTRLKINPKMAFPVEVTVREKQP